MAKYFSEPVNGDQNEDYMSFDNTEYVHQTSLEEVETSFDNTGDVHQTSPETHETETGSDRFWVKLSKEESISSVLSISSYCKYGRQTKMAGKIKFVLHKK